jgi:hypothetical protein
MKVGSFIECINSSFILEQINLIPNRPIKGEYYTVREIEEVRGKVGIRLEEIENPLIENISGRIFEPSFDISRFREIEDIPDIKALIDEIFKEELIIID